jgi:hypothetical protein
MPQQNQKKYEEHFFLCVFLFFKVPLSRFEPNKYINYEKQASILEIVKKR